jgi:hypothetical protein
MKKKSNKFKDVWQIVQPICSFTEDSFPPEMRSKKDMKKVFCNNCDYYTKVTFYGYVEADCCSYKENIKYNIVPDSPIEPSHEDTYSFIRNCLELNHDNHCKWYKEKQPYGGL